MFVRRYHIVIEKKQVLKNVKERANCKKVSKREKKKARFYISSGRSRDLVRHIAAVVFRLA